MASSLPNDPAAPQLDLIAAYCQQFYMSFKRVGAPRSKPQPIVASLSPKEEEILLWVAAGRSDDQIAATLNISANTVDTHLRHIFQKLEVNNRVGAVVKAIMAGLINP
jgi:DNA-binding CsgD family transcriptional regulator